MNEYLIKVEGYLTTGFQWLVGLSERTLSLTAISILYLTFLPDLVAYLNHLTDKLPSLNSYTLVTAALLIMFMRAIFKGDKVQSVIHLIGITSQVYTIAFILMK